MFLRTLILMFATTAGISTLASGQAPVEYQVEFLGSATRSRAINSAGDCVGDDFPPGPGGVQRGWVSIGGAPRELLPLPSGMVSSSATDINDAGQIVGSVGVYPSTEVSHAVTWLPDGSGGYTVELLGSLPGYDTSIATAVNNVGQIIGLATSPGTGTGTPMLFASTGNIGLWAAYGFSAVCRDINDNGEIVGLYEYLDLNTGVTQDIPCAGRAINESGQIGGSRVVTHGHPSTFEAVRYEESTGIEVLTSFTIAYTEGYGINEGGDVTFGAWVYFDAVGTFTLPELVAPASSGWTSLGGYDIDINDSRQIVAIGVNSSTGEEGAVRLTPVIVGQFVRGDSNGDGSVDVADPIFTLNYLFVTGDPSECESALDSNDDEFVDISDAAYVLTALFAGGPSPLPPYPGCGEDPTPGSLMCTTACP